MTSETAKVKSRLSVLESAFDDLEELLEPLLAQSLPETIMALGPIQQAKLQTMLPYLVYDLVFIYLKTRGIDPKSHPVISELDRVRQYFEKITNAEKAQDKPATKLDKDAAGRFIKHAIAQASKHLDQNESQPSSSSAPTILAPVKITSKMVARAQYEQELKEQADHSSDEELEVIDDASELIDERSMDVDGPFLKSTEGTQNVAADGDDTRGSMKRKRPAIDPFAGYGESSPGSTEPSYSGPAQDIKVKPSIASSTPSFTNEKSPSRPSTSKPQGSKKKSKR